MGIDGKTNRIAHYFQDVAPTPLSDNTHRIGLHLSKSQAYTVGLGSFPQPYFIEGTGFADCIAKAEAYIKDNFPGCVL